MKTVIRLAAFFACSAVMLPAIHETPAARAQDNNPAVQLNVQYGEAGGEKLLLDVYGADAKQKRPAIVMLHGGGWAAGSKSDLEMAAFEFARRGYVCFSVEYRLVKEGGVNRFPAQIDDVQRAVRWIRAHAADYGVNPDKIGGLGLSAGGHLVSLLGTTDTRDNGDTELAKYSSRLQCVVDLYGPADLTPPADAEAAAAAAMAKGGDVAEAYKLVANFLGPYPENADNYTAASPIKHIDKDTVPFLIFHGGKDTLVPVEQSIAFDAALRKAGIESKLVIFPNAGHAYTEPELLIQTLTQALDFYNRHLKN